MADLTDEVERLTRQVQLLEDERAIHRTLVRYGFAVDTDDAPATANLYADDCVIEIDGGLNVFRGAEGVHALVNSEAHQAILPNCAHMMGPFVIDVDGDRAVATGYACVVVRSGDTFGIWREGCNRWELERRDGAWRITHRRSVGVGNPGAQEVLSRGL